MHEAVLEELCFIRFLKGHCGPAFQLMHSGHGTRSALLKVTGKNPPLTVLSLGGYEWGGPHGGQPVPNLPGRTLSS
ncbi:hypothetical protein MNVI_04050 [Mycobacterium noviomagense]|uniref:Uncharacterized protein n=1 Tax=Mycobacterium noviomagense TaxID=459858 RepID=A0A7I7P940_9MYCO|nr:hypothetical protein MNVI_04050 [Mycobacterium noviomagense]